MSPEISKLQQAFNPGTVVVVGDKQQNNYMWLKALKEFKGNLYSVQIDPREIPEIEKLGITNYRTLDEVPDPVDYVIVAVPRQVSPGIVADCIRKKASGVALFTSGFAETGTPEGIQLQEVLRDMAVKSNLNLVGPNCMGLYNRRLNLKHSVTQPGGSPGEAGFISQSGTHATFFCEEGEIHGVKVALSASYGNAIVLDSVDFLQFMAQYGEIKVIGMYIEGVKDGIKFFRTLRKIVPQKPVVIWKAGLTEDGSRAALSHTASLAESPVIWDSLFKQTGAIPVGSRAELIEVIKSLIYIKPVIGIKAGLIAMSGGQSVVFSEAFAKAGLKVPRLSPESYKTFSAFFNVIGGSYQNPLDVSWNLPSVEVMIKMLEILSSDSNIDMIALEVSPFFQAKRWEDHPDFFNEMSQALVKFRDNWPKPFFLVVVPGPRELAALEIRDKLKNVGLPSFSSFESAACTINKVANYYRFLAKSHEDNR